jgi:hypothetical protein
MDKKSWIEHFEMESDKKPVQNLKEGSILLVFLVWFLGCFVKA